MRHTVYATAVTFDRYPVFAEHRFAEIVVSSILHAHEKAWAEVYAFVVMPDHMHILFLPLHKTESEVMKSIKGYSASEINSLRGCRWPVWQARFHSRMIAGDRFFFLQKIKYIEENPVRAGLCQKSEDWPWSSLRYPEILRLRT